MSKVRKARFAATNSSTQRSGFAHHELAGHGRAMNCAPCLVRTPLGRLGSRAWLAFLVNLSGRLLQLGQLRDQLVVPVPLNEIGPAHVGAVLGRPAAVMPEVEIKVLDRLIERLGREELMLP